MRRNLWVSSVNQLLHWYRSCSHFHANCNWTKSGSTAGMFWVTHKFYFTRSSHWEIVCCVLVGCSTSQAWEQSVFSQKCHSSGTLPQGCLSFFDSVREGEQLWVTVHTIPPNVYRAKVMHVPYRSTHVQYNVWRNAQYNVWCNATFTLHLAQTMNLTGVQLNSYAELEIASLVPKAPSSLQISRNNTAHSESCLPRPAAKKRSPSNFFRPAALPQAPHTSWQ